MTAALQIKKWMVVLSGALVLPVALHAATYTVGPSEADYITFSALFSAVDLGPGDIVEAKAATAGGSYTFKEQVQPGANDFGTVANPLFIRGRPGDTITISAENLRNYCFVVSDSTADGFYLHNLTFTGANQYLVRFDGVSTADYLDGVTVANCSFLISSNAAIGNSHEGFLCEYANNVKILNNNITTDAASMPYQTDGIYVQNSPIVLVEGNTITMRNNNGIGHNDCIQFANINPEIVYDHTIRNNRLIQDNSATTYTQLIFHEYTKNGTLRIYNNQLIVKNPNTGSFALTVTPKSASTLSLYIDSNSLWTNGNNPGFRVDEFVPNPYIRNNIYANDSTIYNTTALWLECTSVTSSRINNNIWFTANASKGNLLRDKSSFKLWAGWQAAGYDTAGYQTSPSFVSPVSNDVRLSAGSVALDAGMDLSPVFLTDAVGTVRPSNAWDIGALQSTNAIVTADPVLNFSVSPATIQPGRSATLTWSTANVTALSITSLGSVELNGSREIFPASTTTYTATAAGATRVETANVTVSVESTSFPVSSWIEAENGTVVAPFAEVDGTIYQASSKPTVAEGGRLSFQFNVAEEGEYAVTFRVDAPTEAYNSIFFNIDAEPTDPLMTCDFPVTNSLQSRVGTWRGNGTYDRAEFSPKYFQLLPGEHEVVIRGREANTRIDKVRLSKRLAQPADFRLR